MIRRKVIVTAAAIGAIGVAFAAQPISVSERSGESERQPNLWMPGANMLMSAHETNGTPLAPPR